MKLPWIFGLCLLMAGCTAKEEAEPALVVNVKAARAEQGDVLLSVSAPATIYPRQKANIAAPLTATIRRLLVQKGDSVKAGQVLAELEDRDLIAQRDEAAAAIADAEASLQKVASGTLPTDVERAQGEVASTEASLNQAQKIYDRRRELFEQGAIPNRDLLASETDLARVRIAHETAKKSLDLLMNQSREQDIRIARSQLDQAKAKLKQLDAQLEYTKIQCPFDGTVIEQYMYPGDMAKPDAPIFTVIDLSVAVARAQVPVSQAGAVRSGQECVFSPADDPESEYHGKSTVVSRAVDPDRRTVEVWCKIPHPDADLRDGVFGSAQIVVGIVPGSVLVPLSAVQFVEGTRQGFVMVVDSKHTAHKRDVETGETFDNKVQIVKGINPKELVIIEGGYGLPDGAEVRLAQGE
jgi:multidrug efflux pump subunit AcrA (membrane-fusion protein)